MSITHLENFVSLLVRGSNELEHHIIKKPTWWPSEIEFSYPIERKRGRDNIKWKSTLLNLVARCYRHGMIDPTSVKLENKKQNIFSPVVVVSDILNVNPKYSPPPSIVKVNKDNFFNYLKLSDKCNHHNYTKFYRHEMNLHLIPFSSNLGRTILARRKIPQRKLRIKQQIIEKYCTNNTRAKKIRRVPLPISRGERKSHRNKENLSEKARRLLQTCTPCEIRLKHLNPLETKQMQYCIKDPIVRLEVLDLTNFNLKL